MPTWRWLNRLYAATFSYFWLPCPICGEAFGGHETGIENLMISFGEGRSVCPKAACQATAARRNREMFATPEARAYLSAMYSARMEVR